MKKMLCLILALALLLCGCQGAPADPTDPRQEGNTENHGTENETQDTDATLPENQQSFSTETIHDGCVRVEYTGNISSVRYITSPDQLPDLAELAGYDAAYFEEKALVLVKETVTSGSVRVGIASMEEGVVTLTHELAGQFGTADMATWLLWAEVDAGLSYDWSVANPAVKLETHTH